MKRITLLLLLISGFFQSAYAIDWPQIVSARDAEIVVYQPQPEKLDGHTLTARAAFQIDAEASDEPVFGVMWFTARLETDRDADLVTVRDVKIDHVTWPDSKDANEQEFMATVESAIPDAGFDMSFSSLSNSLETAEVVQQSLDELNNEPPKIRFAESLTVLLVYDGEPRLSEIENSPYERVLNAPFAVACKKRGRECWLSSGEYWYRADDPLGPWRYSTNPPRDLVENMKSAETSEDQPDSPPAIAVATEPTELIVTDGKPEWTPLQGGDLLYVSNTESPWLRYLPSGNMYVLLSGRWYRAKSVDGPWTFVKPDELPDAFAQIPPASDIGGLRTAVAGTPEAEDAVRDQAIPQTAAIDRSTATLTVEYDGRAKFQKIKGTDVSYAVNTGAQVLEIGGRYYAVDNGVWFTSRSATGPWAVADEVPTEQIAEIPASSPVYNTTHVHIYESTPEVVYVGYTPGYLWSYPHYGVPVYGTGWYYPPYYGRWYYPRPPTWGFHVGYNPWTGWNFGSSWSNGFFSFGMSWSSGYGGAYRPWGCCGGWYGGGYRGPTIINNGTINIGNTVNVGNRSRVGRQVNARDRVGRNDRMGNLYNRPANRDRKADRMVADRSLKKARPSNKHINNVFADQNGHVTRPNGDKWQTRDKGKWKDAADRNPVRPDTRPAPRPAPKPDVRPAPRPDTRPAPRPAPKPDVRPAPKPDVRPAPRPAPKPNVRPAPRPDTRPAPRPAPRPATRPSSRDMGYRRPATSRPRSGSLNTHDLNRSYNARQRGHVNNRSHAGHRAARSSAARPMPMKRPR
ncbi:MAG: carbohydrate-binding family V/XII [Xanthomonadales bacterium]|nr:carbohydrate-binding family V/XII [Xanthomonadales bacterium]